MQIRAAPRCLDTGDVTEKSQGQACWAQTHTEPAGRLFYNGVSCLAVSACSCWNKN